MNHEEKTLAELMDENDEQEARKREESQKRRSPAPAVTQLENENLPPSRQGKRPYTMWIPPDAHKIIRILAAEDDVSQEQIGKDALNALFRERGRPPIA